MHAFRHFLETFDLSALPPLDRGPTERALPRAGLLERAARGGREAPARDSARAEVALGLALLWHGHWEAAHAIAQADEGEPDHDLLHAILHRREGDFSNAGYWFRSAGDHPALRLLEARATEALKEADPALRSRLLPEGRWSARAFVDAVRRSDRGTEPLLRRLQAEETLAFLESLAR